MYVLLELLFTFLLALEPDSPSLSERLAPSDTSSQPQLAPRDSSSAIVLRFGGDCLLAGHYEEDAADSVSLAFSAFDLLKTADIAMVNLECPITTRGVRIEKPYNFRMHPRFLSALVSAGVDVVNIANNHIFDYGEVGLFDTISYLDSAGMLHVGAGRDGKQAHTPVVISENGKRIAFLGYYGGGEAPKASAVKAGVADRTIKSILPDIIATREQDTADFVVVNLHWGTEKDEYPDQGQVQFAHMLIDAGADLIVGHHPHVLQGIEKYKLGIIVYSLGNLIFGGKRSDTYDTAMFEVSLSQEERGYRLIPIRIEKWHARELIGADGDKVIEHVRKLSSVFPESIFRH